MNRNKKKQLISIAIYAMLCCQQTMASNLIPQQSQETAVPPPAAPVKETTKHSAHPAHHNQSGHTAATKNLVVNGDFEYAPEGSGHTTIYKGDNRVYGWTVTEGDVDIIYQDNHNNVQFGRKCIDLSGGTAGIIAQTIATQPGATYDVKFWVGSSNDCGGGPKYKPMFVRAAGESSSWNVPDATGRPDGGWSSKEWRFKAKESQTVLEFGSLTSSNCGPLLDNVVVTRGSGGNAAKSASHGSPEQAAPAASEKLPEVSDEDDVSGTWTFSTCNNQFRGFINLKQTGKQITGLWHMTSKQEEDTPIVGQISGNSVSLKRYKIWNTNEQTYQLHLSKDGNQLFGYGEGFFLNHSDLNMSRSTPKKKKKEAAPQLQSGPVPAPIVEDDMPESTKTESGDSEKIPSSPPKDANESPTINQESK